MSCLLWVSVVMHYIIDTVVNLVFRLIYCSGARSNKLKPIKHPFLVNSASSLAAKIRTKQLSLEKLVQACIDRIVEVNADLNCVVDSRFQDALAEARSVDQFLESTSLSVDELKRDKPFLGVPFTCKESIQAADSQIDDDRATAFIFSSSHSIYISEVSVAEVWGVVRLLRDLGGKLCNSQVIKNVSVRHLEFSVMKSLRVPFLSQTFRIYMNDLPSVIQSTKLRLLGLSVDKPLSWDFHMEHVCQRLCSICLALSRLSRVCSLQVLLTEKPIPFYALSCLSSWATGMCEDLIKQNKGESRYSTRLLVLIKSAMVTDMIRIGAISNSDPKSNVLDRSAIGISSILQNNMVLEHSNDVKFAGMNHTMGLVSRKGTKASEDSTVVARVKAGGGILLAVTNIPEFIWQESRNNVYGQTNNPYDFHRTAGASSGGCVSNYIHFIY
ncbi:hypothetical protein J6590_036846 [Homalodisca vitripennis]|nr:hypothetical protein J6590_036846 [Homalodisca vitripennis]